MKKAVISGDIIAYTSLTTKDRETLENSLRHLLRELRERFDVFGRLIKGDYLECVVPSPEMALSIALIIKSYIKTVKLESVNKTDNRFKFFKTHGIRLAIGYGTLSRLDPEKNIIDGEAIYFSGRTIGEESTHNKERVVIKNTLFFKSSDEKLNAQFEPLLALIDVLISKSTARQCEVLFLKLMNFNEEEIAEKIKISQPVVNQHSTSVGWNAIEKAVSYFREVIKSSM